MAAGPPDLGSRGQGYVALQFLLLLVLAIVGTTASPWPVAVGTLRVVGGLLLAIGGALAIAGLLRLGPALTPMPRPLPGAPLSSGGVYGWVRHPIYGGLLIGGFGWCLATGPWALLPWLLLAGLFAVKARREEAWLRQAHDDYDEYATTVWRRFVPGLW